MLALFYSIRLHCLPACSACMLHIATDMARNICVCVCVRVCVCACVSGTVVNCAETGELIEMLFWKQTYVGSRNHVLDVVQIIQICHEKGHFFEGG